MNLQIKDNCTYFYNDELEFMLAAVSLLSNNADSDKFFDAVKINRLKEKYYFLAETINLFEANGFFGIFEFLADIDPKVTILEFKERLMSLERNEFLKTFLFLHEPVISQSCEDFYKEHKNRFKSFFGCATFFNETKRIILEFCNFSSELRQDFSSAFEHIQKDRDAAAKIFKDRLSKTEPLEFSQKLMGKVFYNKGPYKHFYFMHSLFTPNKKAIRYFGVNQVLFYPLYAVPINEDDIINNLRALADSTRIKILLLLKEKNTMRGIDIAAQLGLTAPTISHHISELRNAGLLHEEQEKNTKYYSVNAIRFNEIISMLEKILK